jgi:2-oxoacid:acceptor oxidoreductase gamma subunit (pyruvate/2-ketoisovalerate family)
MQTKPAVDVRLPFEVRWHGRGGQGAVTVSRLLASGALATDYYPQSLPDFSAERAGAPVAAYTRIDRTPPTMRGPVLEPSAVVVIDPTLLDAVNVVDGLAPGGLLVVNTREDGDAVAEAVGRQDIVICTADGSAIAMRTIGRPLPNVPMLGALLQAVPLIEKDVMIGALRKQLGELFPERIVEANIDAFEEGYESAQTRDAK